MLLREFSELQDQLWGGEFWKHRYFARTVGDEITAEVIRKYIQYHQEREGIPEQLELFWS
ncbi:transposase [Candidatus Bipolaricaulota bacterium]|nr:transposase [Candidatus Bipolaricaulota bacterium]